MGHLYIHVPFCRRRCTYCDFAISVRKRVPHDDYVVAVLRELEIHRSHGRLGDDGMETIYFGGGTPSLLDPGKLTKLIRALAPSESTEVTLEANPEDVTEERAAAWVEAGVNRISLGAQSFSADVLRWMHRSHGPDAVSRAVEVARRSGLASISLDLIFGLPEAIGTGIGIELDELLALKPEHVSLYGLTIEPGTALAHRRERGELTPIPDERYAEEYLAIHDRLTATGFEHYEVSNFALPGHVSRHNSSYWRLKSYLGVGPSAHRYDSLGRTRAWNTRHWEAYRRLVESGADPTEGTEVLTDDQVRLERVLLGLRTSQGVPRSWLLEREDVVAVLIESGWATEPVPNTLALTPEGWLRMDRIVLSLTTPSGGG